MYISSNVAERIKSVVKIRNISMKQVLLEAGLNYNAMTHMKTSMPKADSLAKIADVLECSVDYLLGRTENINIDADIDDNEALILAAYRQADMLGKMEIMKSALSAKTGVGKNGIVYRAARSSDDHEAIIETMSDDFAEKLQNAPKVTSDDDI